MEVIIWILASAAYLYLAIEYLDIAVTMFVCLTALFSPGFVHLHFPGTPLYVTELFLLFALFSIFLKVRRSTPFKWPEYKLKNLFFILYIIGGISLARGLILYTDRVFVLRHAALFYYSILYFMVPIIYDNFIKIKRFAYCFIASCGIILIVWLIKGSLISLNFAFWGSIYLAMAILLLSGITESSRTMKWAFILLTGFGSVWFVDSMGRALWVAVTSTIIFTAVFAVFQKRSREVAVNILFKGVPVALLFISVYFVFNIQNIEPFVVRVLSIDPALKIKHIQNNSLKNLENRFGNTGTTRFREISNKSSEGPINTRWRLVCWQDIINETLQKPVLGWGFGKKFVPPTIKKFDWGGSWREPNPNDSEAKGFQDPHNSYLSVFHRTGLIGLTVFMSLMIYFFFTSVKFINISHNDLNTNMVVAFLLIFVFINCLSMFMVVLESPYLGIFCWLSMGFVETIRNIEINAEGVHEPAS